MPTLINATHLTGFVPAPTSTHITEPGGRSLPDPGPACRPAGRLVHCLRTGATAARYSMRFLPAVLRSHALVTPAILPVLRLSTCLPKQRVGAWKAFFQHPEPSTPAFTYFTPENSRLLFRLLGEFGLNIRHLLLVQHELVTHPRAGDPVPNGNYELEAHIEELQARPRQRVSLACRCVVRRTGDPAPVCETSDRFLVKEVPEHDWEELARRNAGTRHTIKESPAPRLDPTSPGVRRHSLAVPIGAGVGFGLLSGDLNLVHTHAGLARWFGHRRAFAQGRYTSNRVMAMLARHTGSLPTRISIHFCRPLFLGQEAVLLHTEDAFEVLDDHGSRVAAGTFGA